MESPSLEDFKSRVRQATVRSDIGRVDFALGQRDGLSDLL